MTGLLSGAVALSICALVVGCTDATQAPAQTTMAASPPARNIPIDGSYNGLAQLVSRAAMSCGTQDMMSLEVKGRAFRYVLNQAQVPWQPQRSFVVVIAQDGSFQGQSGPAYIRGQVNQGHMQGQIVGDACGYRFEADRSGTW